MGSCFTVQYLRLGGSYSRVGIRLPTEISRQEWGGEKNKQASWRSWFTWPALLGSHWKCFSDSQKSPAVTLCGHILHFLWEQTELLSNSEWETVFFTPLRGSFWGLLNSHLAASLQLRSPVLSNGELWECHPGYLIDAKGGGFRGRARTQRFKGP